MRPILFRRLLLVGAAVAALIVAGVFALPYYRYFSNHVSTDDGFDN
jgi:hypothetical protein